MGLGGDVHRERISKLGESKLSGGRFDVRSRFVEAVRAVAAAGLAAVAPAQVIGLGEDQIRPFEVAVFGAEFFVCTGLVCLVSRC